MPPRNLNNLANKYDNDDSDDRDKKMRDIISALNFLQKEAKKMGDEDISRIIESTCSICLHTFLIIKKNELRSIITNSDTTKNIQ